MITAHDIAHCESFEYVHISGRAIQPSDPMVADTHGYIGARIRKLVRGSDLRQNCAKWDRQGRIIDNVSPYAL